MPNPVNETNIIAPRVPLIDERTGLISREWYRFFLNLFVLTGSGRNDTSLLDLQVGPPALTQEDFNGIVVNIESLKTQPTQESALDQIAELQKQIDALASVPSQVVGLLSQLADVNALNPSDGDKLIYDGTIGKWEQDSRSYLMLE